MADPERGVSECISLGHEAQRSLSLLGVSSPQKTDLGARVGQVTSRESEFLSAGQGEVSPPVSEQDGGMVVDMGDPDYLFHLGYSRLPRTEPRLPTTG